MTKTPFMQREDGGVDAEGARIVAQRIAIARWLWRLAMRVCTYQVGGVSLFGVLIIVLAISVNLVVFQRQLFARIDVNRVRRSVGPISLKGNHVLSLVPESTDVLKAGMGAPNVVDGSLGAVAAPGSASIDYVIDLGGLIEVYEVIIYWGTYGTDPMYVKQWVLEGKTNTSVETSWDPLGASDRFPNSMKSVVRVNRRKLAQLRLSASGMNYIGVQEVQVNGRRIAE